MLLTGADSDCPTRDDHGNATILLPSRHAGGGWSAQLSRFENEPPDTVSSQLLAERILTVAP